MGTLPRDLLRRLSPEILLCRLVLPPLVRTLSTSQVKMVWPTVHETSELVSSILEKMGDIPSCQERAREQATHVEFVSNLNMYSTANKMRLSGIVCTIGPVSREPATLLELIENGMNVARMNFSHGSHEYHAQTMANCRTAAKMYKEKHGVDPNLAIALDTKGPEIRTGLLEGDDGRKELTLKAGASIKITTDEAFKEKCTSEVLWLDYKNITKVMEVGKRLFIDDGLISVKCTEIGSDHFIGMIETLAPRRAVTFQAQTLPSPPSLRRTSLICCSGWSRELTWSLPPSSGMLMVSNRSAMCWARRGRTSG